MYCMDCGKEISNKAVVCIHCGSATRNMNSNPNQQQPIIINNSPSASSSSSSSASSSSSSSSASGGSCLFDSFMIIITGGLWIIWMIFRPKRR